MTHNDVQVWLDRYIAAWSSYDPEAIGALFADDAEYRYQPWADPVVGRDAIVADWLSDKDESGSWAAHYDVWAFDGERQVRRVHRVLHGAAGAAARGSLTGSSEIGRE